MYEAQYKVLKQNPGELELRHRDCESFFLSFVANDIKKKDNFHFSSLAINLGLFSSVNKCEWKSVVKFRM